MDRLEALTRHWERTPPIHIAFASFARAFFGASAAPTGVSRTAPAAVPPPPDESALADLMTQFPMVQR